MTTPAAWIESARVSPSSGTRELDDLLRDRVGVDLARELGARLETLLERLTRPFRDQLRDPVDDAVGNLEHAAGVPDRRRARPSSRR